MRFDPEWFTSGVTANDAAAEDGAVEPGQPVPNDNYRVDEGHRLLTYLVPADTPVTVLTREGDPQSFGATPITVTSSRSSSTERSLSSCTSRSTPESGFGSTSTRSARSTSSTSRSERSRGVCERRVSVLRVHRRSPGGAEHEGPDRRRTRGEDRADEKCGVVAARERVELAASVIRQRLRT